MDSLSATKVSSYSTSTDDKSEILKVVGSNISSSEYHFSIMVSSSYWTIWVWATNSPNSVASTSDSGPAPSILGANLVTEGNI